jgi:hypothetical protein
VFSLRLRVIEIVGLNRWLCAAARMPGGHIGAP